MAAGWQDSQLIAWHEDGHLVDTLAGIVHFIDRDTVYSEEEKT